MLMPPGGEWGRASIDAIAIGCSTCQMCCSRINHQIPISVEFSISKIQFFCRGLDLKLHNGRFPMAVAIGSTLTSLQLIAVKSSQLGKQVFGFLRNLTSKYNTQSTSCFTNEVGEINCFGYMDHFFIKMRNDKCMQFTNTELYNISQ